MRWIHLTELSQIASIDHCSQELAVLIFKHSTRCIISTMILNRLEREWDEEDDGRHPIFLLDLLAYRSISTAIADHYDVEHASPQVLIIRNGQCVYSATHTSITYDDLREELADGSHP